MTVPKHYLKNFHPDYVDPDELLAKAQADGFDTWYDYYYEKRDFRINPDIPVLTAWKPESGLVGREIQYWTRNPYYWKVDEAGNQLPYIDRVAVRIVGEREILNMMIANGEIDLDFANMTLPDYPFLKEHEESGGYRVLLWKLARSCSCSYSVPPRSWCGLFNSKTSGSPCPWPSIGKKSMSSASSAAAELR